MKKKLTKSSTDKIIFGVCGGIAEYFEVDAVIVRLILVLISLAGGAGVLFYIIAAIVMPDDPREVQNKTKSKTKGKKDKVDELTDKVEAVAEDFANKIEKGAKRNSSSQIFGLILIGLGLYFMVQRFVPWFNIGNFWWLILIAIGFVILVGGRRE